MQGFDATGKVVDCCWCCCSAILWMDPKEVLLPGPVVPQRVPSVARVISGFHLRRLKCGTARKAKVGCWSLRMWEL